MQSKTQVSGNKKQQLIFMLLLTTLCACGFQLRGTGLEGISVYVKSSHADVLADQLRLRLQETDAIPASDISMADYVIALSNESYDDRALSFSATTGKIQEYEIHYSALLEIFIEHEEEPIIRQGISASREYIFDENAILGKSTERAVLRTEIAEQLASSILRQLRVLSR